MASSVEGHQVRQGLQVLQNSEQTDQPAVCGYSSCCAAAQGMSRHAQLVRSSNCQNTQNSSALAAILPCLQGLQWSYAQLALDLLELHDEETVKEELKPFAAKNDNYGDSDQQAAQILDVLYAECTEVFAVWLEELHDKLPASSFLVSAGRSASATSSTEYLADALKTEEQRDVQAQRLMVALGRNLHDCNKLLPPHEWLSVAAKGSFAGSNLVRGDAVKVGTDRLVQDMLATQSSSSFMQEMLADSSQTSPEQAAYLSNLPQQVRTDAAIPPQCWRLAAIAMKRDIWILDVRLWRLSCYSCHDGSVCVYGNSAGTHSQLSKHWTEPGYHFRLGQLTLPQVLAENGHTYMLLLMESSGQIVSSSMMSVTQLASAQSRTLAVKSLGYELAAMDVNSKGQLIRHFLAAHAQTCHSSQWHNTCILKVVPCVVLHNSTALSNHVCLFIRSRLGMYTCTEY